jgi:Fe-S-cluster containining protein
MSDASAEKLAVAARESISRYCYMECRAFCCRRGYLLLTGDEVNVMRGARKEDMQVIPTAMDAGEGFVFDLGAGDGCPNLMDYKCTIHSNPMRPNACKEFPLFIWEDKTIMVTYACPAVKEAKLYPYLAKFKRMGYKLVYIEGKE